MMPECKGARMQALDARMQGCPTIAPATRTGPEEEDGWEKELRAVQRSLPAR